jgi:NADH:ubiquinone reductase (H+-translocating)
MNSPYRVVIVGGGFGGLCAVQALRRASVEVTLVDRRNFHLFQPLLYQVATGGLSSANIAAPLRKVLKRQKNARVLLAEATDFELKKRRLVLADGRLDYDALIVAPGSDHWYFGHDDWARFAPGLKSIEDATEIRRRVLGAFEAAEREMDPAARQATLTFVVIGGGPTGVELAGAVAEVAHGTLTGEFRTFDPAEARIVLVEGVDRVLPPFPPPLSARALRDLAHLGVEIRLNTRVEDIEADRLVVSHDGRREEIAARTILWGAGVKASPLGRQLALAACVETDRSGRVPVGPDLSLAGWPEVFAIGDIAHCLGADGKPLAATAPVAMQQGRYVARLIRDRLRGRTTEPFRYRDHGAMATIGRNRAVASIGPVRLTGRLAWFVWLFVHLMYIVAFENRVLILLQWAWNYFTRNRTARLIIDQRKEELPPE